MNNQEFSPRESLEYAFKFWWVIVLLTAMGGIVGWAIHFFLPPLYEATAVITVNMDFQKVKLTQNEEDYAFNAAGAIGNSTGVRDQVIAEAQIKGFPKSANQLLEQMFSERMQSVWEFHVRNRNPATAAKLANLWAETTRKALDVALGHALLADQIQEQIDSVIRSRPASEVTISDPKNQVTLKTLSDELLKEKEASQGIISIMKFSQTGSATDPQKPILYNLADLVLAGACIGFVISLWAVSSHKVMRRG
jgi:LPS O-antigen subunit length determinant protein (WzzB/FepE family)